MIVRFVKMTFIPGREKEFIEIFNKSRNKIRNFNGCTHLELLRDVQNDNVFFTYSKWMDERSLEAYRNSELFNATWAATKVLFAARAEAWSLSVLDK